MVFEKLFNLFNVAEDSFLNVLKFLSPLLILLIIYLIVKWIQLLNNASKSNIIVMNRPS